MLKMLKRLREMRGLKSSFILKGNICHTPSKDKLEVRENAYLVCQEGLCQGIFDTVPDELRTLEIMDCSGCLIMPGMVDLHIHAPQYAFRGTGMDYELLDWLGRRTFPEEIRYSDIDYARKAYRLFAERMKNNATTRAVIFGTVHREATLCLMDIMEETGLVTFVGKVNMDRNSPEELIEKDAAASAADTRRFIEEAALRGYKRTRPIITPRFVLSCTDELMEELGKIQREYGLPVQSHLSENPQEVETVLQLVPEAAFYGDCYDRYGLFGGPAPTVMAHCVYSTPEETERIRENGVWVAHCPGSNMNLASGIAPMRRYLDMGIRAGLGTDVAAGTSTSIFRVVTEAIQVSKLYWRYIDPDAGPLTFQEAFYLATKGGGSFFGKAGSFEPGYEFDAIVLDDSIESSPGPIEVRDRLERAFYTGYDHNCIIMKFAAGERII